MINDLNNFLFIALAVFFANFMYGVVVAALMSLAINMGRKQPPDETEYLQYTCELCKGEAIELFAKVHPLNNETIAVCFGCACGMDNPSDETEIRCEERQSGKRYGG